jgi:hypothetical protein
MIMSTAIAATPAPHPATAHRLCANCGASARSVEIELTAATTAGVFSLFQHGPFSIRAEAGLAIRVNAGCLWVPSEDGHFSVGAGSHFVVPRAGNLTVLSSRGTEVELEWPPRSRDRRSVH